MGDQRRAVRCRRRTDCECHATVVKPRHQSLREAEFGFEDTRRMVLLTQIPVEGLGSNELKCRLRCEPRKTFVTSTQTGRH